jgi:dihydroorotate dehydrogenase electron transfer subunit
MKRLECEIKANTKIAPDHYKMTVDISESRANITPGQFIMALCSDDTTPLLRRPFGIHRVAEKGKTRRMDILYKVVGPGTRNLSLRKPGRTLDIIGPLGNGFDLRAGSLPERAVLVAGGRGVAPLFELASRLREKKIKTDVLIGACDKKHILCVNDFKRLGCRLEVATEDGSSGKKGFVTDLLEVLLKHNAGEKTYLYCCGPKEMLRAAFLNAKRSAVPAWGSFEEYMACGIGACMSCAVRVKTGKGKGGWEYKMACKDGPVFNLDDIVW